MTNLNLYKTFVVVAECKNITTASKKLFISQPALTMQIKQLEESVGGSLFVRKNKGLELTSLGTLLLDNVKPLIGKLDELENIGDRQSKLESGFLRIGSNSSNCNQIISQYLIAFAKQYPNINISMCRESGDRLVEMLEEDKLDIIFTDTCNTPKDILEIKKFPVVYQLIGNYDYYLKYKDYQINDKDFPLEDLILPNSKNNSRKYIDDYMYENNIKFNPKYELDNYILVYDFVKNGLGIAFVNLDYYEDKIDKKEVYPLCPNTTINLRNFSVYCNSNAFNPAKTKFCDILK